MNVTYFITALDIADLKCRERRNRALELAVLRQFSDSVLSC